MKEPATSPSSTQLLVFSTVAVKIKLLSSRKAAPENAAVKLKDKRGIALKQKIESIDVFARNQDGSLGAYAISDNDDGKSTWFMINLLAR